MIWLGLSMASIAWAAATPLGASPDEPAHIIKAAAVARGEFLGDPTGEPAVTEVSVPEGIAEAQSWACYAFNPAISAACIPAPQSGLGLDDARTSAGLYNPAYYVIVGWPSLFIENAEAAVLAMRSISAVVCSFFLAVSFVLLLRVAGKLLAGLAFFASLTPMVLFLSGAVNPNALEIASGLAFTAGLLYLTRPPPASRSGIVYVVVALSGFVLVNTRGLSPLWAALAGTLVLVATPASTLKILLRTREVWITMGVVLLGVTLAAAWLIRTNTLSSMGVFPGAGETEPATAFLEMLINRTFDPGVVGVFGWLDTPAPPWSFAVSSGLLAIVLLLSLVTGRGRSWWAATGSLALTLLVPPIVQALSVSRSGYIWQGRYTLIAVCFTLFLSAVACAASGVMARVPTSIERRIVVVVGLSVVTSQVLSLLTTLNRYGGTPGYPFVSFLTATTWTPPLGGILWLGVLTAGLCVVVYAWQVSDKVDRFDGTTATNGSYDGDAFESARRVASSGPAKSATDFRSNNSGTPVDQVKQRLSKIMSHTRPADGNR